MPPKRTRRTDHEVALRLTAARKAAGLSQADVEHLMRNAMPSGGWFSQAKIRRIEHGDAGFTTMELGMLAGVYGVTVASLSPEAGDEWASIVEMFSAVQSRCFASSSLRKQAAQLVQT
jgi:transcriptional regulator with XRE-family HTH domain